MICKSFSLIGHKQKGWNKQNIRSKNRNLRVKIEIALCIYATLYRSINLNLTTRLITKRFNYKFDDAIAEQETVYALIININVKFLITKHDWKFAQ